MYAAPFHRMVLLGTQFEDTFATTLSFAFLGTPPSAPAVTPELVEAVRQAVGTAWSSDANGVRAQALLTSVKLNRIGTNGRYMDSDAQEHVFSTPRPGGGTGGNPVPPQIAMVVSWEGASPRARAGRGRMYLPAPAAAAQLGTDGRVTVPAARDAGEFAISLINAAKSAYNAADLYPVAAITSNVGSGAVQAIAACRVGRVLDTVRTRRNKLSEEYQTVTLGA